MSGTFKNVIRWQGHIQFELTPMRFKFGENNIWSKRSLKHIIFKIKISQGQNDIKLLKTGPHKKKSLGQNAALTNTDRHRYHVIKNRPITQGGAPK